MTPRNVNSSIIGTIITEEMTTYIKLNRLGLGSNKLFLISGANNEKNAKTKNPKRKLIINKYNISLRYSPAEVKLDLKLLVFLKA